MYGLNYKKHLKMGFEICKWWVTLTNTKKYKTTIVWASYSVKKTLF